MFRDSLGALQGRWSWEDIGDDVFEGLSMHVGILNWRSGSSARRGELVDRL